MIKIMLKQHYIIQPLYSIYWLHKNRQTTNAIYLHTVADSNLMSEAGLSVVPTVGTLPKRCRMCIPECTRPNIVCLPSSLQSHRQDTHMIIGGAGWATVLTTE